MKIKANMLALKNTTLVDNTKPQRKALKKTRNDQNRVLIDDAVQAKL